MLGLAMTVAVPTLPSSFPAGFISVLAGGSRRQPKAPASMLVASGCEQSPFCYAAVNSHVGDCPRYRC